MGPDSRGQRGRSGLAAGGCRLLGLLGPGVGVGCLAGFQSDGISGEGAGLQGRGEAGDEVFVGKVAAEQENFNQGPGAVAFAVGFDGGFPPGVVDGVNRPAARAWSRAVAPGRAPGLRISASR
ncbi:hypothetical protein ACWEWI_40225 [Streptomyces sp. NPDC003753]